MDHRLAVVTAAEDAPLRDLSAAVYSPEAAAPWPAADLDAVVRFYRDGLGFAMLGSFVGHDGSDGVMLDQPVASFDPYWDRDGTIVEYPV